MNARKLTMIALGCVCATAAALAFASAPAFAEKIYYPGISFGSEGSGPGQFKEPVGVAVNDSTGLEPGAGDVYVVDEGNNRVERFSSSGVYLGQFNGSGTYEVENKEVMHGLAAPTGAFSHPDQIAVDNSGNPLDPSAGDVYVTDTAHKAIDKFSPTGEYLGQITETKVCELSAGHSRNEVSFPCPKGKAITVPFTELRNVAVGPAGETWAFEGEEENGYLDKFSDVGTLEAEYQAPGFLHAAHSVTVDSGGRVFVGNGLGPELDELGVTHHNGDFEESTKGTLAVASVPSTVGSIADDLLADKGGEIFRLAPSENLCTSNPCELESFPGESVPEGYEGLSESYGLAVNGSAQVFATERGADRVQIFAYVPEPKVIAGAPSEVSESALTLHGKVDPEGERVKECYFEYGTEADVYTAAAAECSPKAGELGEGTAEISVQARVSGLEAASVRSFRLVAVSEAGVVSRSMGVTVSRPIVSAPAATGVGSSTALAVGELDPGGLEACFLVEYGPTAVYGLFSSRECVPAGDEAVSVSVELVGLAPGSRDHFRFVATNALGSLAGGDVAFATFGPSSAGLPDGRSYEAVSSVSSGEEAYVPLGMVVGPLDTNGGVHGLAAGHLMQAAADGDALAYVGATAATTGGTGTPESGRGEQFLATRSPGGGWTQSDLQSKRTGAYWAFASDLSAGVLEGSQLAADAPAEYDNLYVRGLAGGTGGVYEPLFTAPPVERSPQEFGYVEDGLFRSADGAFSGANAGTGAVPAFSHVLFEASAKLPSVPEAPSVSVDENNLYDSVGGRLHLVNVLPDGTPQASATFGHRGFVEAVVTPRSAALDNVISADGSRVFWTAVRSAGNGNGEGAEESVLALYVRENDTMPEGENGECEPHKACTVQLDLAEPEAAGPSGGGHFWTASSDGSRVFFTDENRLTKDSKAVPHAPDLYEYDLQAPEGERLTDLSVPVKGTGGGDVQGVVGTSQDGSYVYFVAGGVLTEGANAEGHEPINGEPNLYLRHEGTTVFVATLAPGDDEYSHYDDTDEPQEGDWQADVGRRTAEVTRDGQSVVFMSERPLTGYDSTLEGIPLTEVFVYDASIGRLVCASCNPSGEPPVASRIAEFSGSGGDIQETHGSFLPTTEYGVTGDQRRVISEDGGRVFFDSIEPLVPQVSNGYLDVYEWEAPGEGTCTPAAASPITGGCTFVLSGGQDEENSYLIDASSSGSDVFFVSRAQLVPGARGQADVVYDARVDGVRPPQPVSCSGTSCQGAPPAPPIFSTPASVTFNGPGNFPPPSVAVPAKPEPKPVKCKKPKKLSHGKCTAKKKSKRKSKHAKKASRDQRPRS
jgi:hypothetical protein